MIDCQSLNTPLLLGQACAVLLTLTFPEVAKASDAQPTTTAPVDKSQYHLFNPTPRDLMRAMSTDRPDQMESPSTLDAGHFQFEMDVMRYSYDRYNLARKNIRVEAVQIAPVNLKAGLLNQVDFQMLLQPYVSVRAHDRDLRTVEKNRGFGDTTFRLKANLWGNEGGRTAFGVMPYIKLPTNQDDLGNNSAEGGIIFPLSIDLASGWNMGLMTEFDWARDEASRGHHAEFVNLINLNHTIAGNLAGFVEFFSSVSAERDSDWVGTFDAGLTYALTEDIQLDAGVFIGLTRSADDWNPFIGLSWRF